MHHPLCPQVAAELEEVVARRAPPAVLHHAGSCAECSRLVARQVRLEALLKRLPAAPRADFQAPRLTEAPLLSLRSARWAAAAAAAALVVVSARIVLHEADTAPTVSVRSVIDVADAPPPQDERLLALTGGLEAVAMRRPTGGR